MSSKTSTSPADYESEQALKGRITFPLIVAVLAAGLGSSFIFGYNIGVINAAGTTIKRWIAESQGYFPQNYSANVNYTDKDFMDGLSEDHNTAIINIWMWVGGIFPLGATFGGLASGFFADKFGRKGGMMLNNILTIVAGLTLGFSMTLNSYWVLILGRFLIGLSCGLVGGLAPLYLTEVSPINYRGLLGSIHQLMITISILVSNLLGFENLLGNAYRWPYLLAFTMAPCLFQLVTLPLCPESPKYLLISKGREDDSRNALIKLRRTVKVEAEIAMMQEEAEKMKNVPTVKFSDFFTQPVLRWAMFIAIMMMLSQQLSGINAAMFYSTEIFEKDAKLSTHSSIMATLGVMTVNVLMTVVSTILVDKAGRRTLHLTGLGGMFVSTICLVVTLHLSSLKHEWAAYASIFFVIAYVISFATGPGTIPWFYVSECFEQGARGMANSVNVGVNGFATFLVGLLFPKIQAAITKYTFLIFTFFLGFFWTFTWKFVPETKGKSVDQVLAELNRQVRKK